MGLSNFDIIKLVQHLKIPDFRGVFMRDTLPSKPREKECGILNLNKFSQRGSHWVAFYKDGGKRIYFDSFGQVVPSELQKYLKTDKEFDENQRVIQRNTDIVQRENETNCGLLCVYVLHNLSQGKDFGEIINQLNGRYLRV